MLRHADPGVSPESGVQYATRMTSTTRAPSIGRIVSYTLTKDDCERVSLARRQREAYTNLPSVVGYNPSPGQVSPMIVTWTSGPAGDFISGQVFLDSNDVLWVERVQPSAVTMQAPGCWHWPEIV